MKNKYKYWDFVRYRANPANAKKCLLEFEPPDSDMPLRIGIIIVISY